MPDKFMDREAASTAGLKYVNEGKARSLAEAENERERNLRKPVSRQAKRKSARR